MTESFNVPADLAGTDLTLAQVRSIVDMRRKRAKLEKRISLLPRKHTELKAEVAALVAAEDGIRNEPTEAGS